MITLYKFNFYKNTYFSYTKKKKKNQINFLIQKKKNENKVNKKIGIYLYNTLNNFYILCIDLANIRKRVLAFVSGGMVNSYKRFNRKKYYTVELCTRKISFFLKQKKIFKVALILKSFFRKKFLRTVLKGLKYHKIFLNKIYDRRSIPHNGCLKPKKRRI